MRYAGLAVSSRVRTRREYQDGRYVRCRRGVNGDVDPALDGRNAQSEELVAAMAPQPPGADPAGRAFDVGLVTPKHGARLFARRSVVGTQLLVLLERPDPSGYIAPVGTAITRPRCWRAKARHRNQVWRCCARCLRAARHVFEAAPANV